MKRAVARLAPWVVAIAAIVLPAGAEAAGTVTASGGTITFTQSSAPARPALSYSVLSAYVFEDSNGLTAGSGCSQVSSTEVSCASAFPRDITFDSAADVDSSVPAGGLVTLEGTTDSGSAVVPIHANNVTGTITTGSGADVITGGSATMTGVVSSGGSADSITIYTDLPQLSSPGDDIPVDYPVSTNEFEGEEDFWPVRIESGSGGDYIDASEGEGGVYYGYGDGCDIFFGGEGSDWAYHGVGAETDTNDDTLVMGPGDDEIWAYDGNEGDDMTYGGPGNDRYIQMVNLGEEMFDGGPGVDTLQTFSWGSWQSLSGDFHMTLDGVRDDGPDGNDIFTSTVENFTSKSLTGRGVIGVGNAANNIISGTANADHMTGGPGADTIGAGGGDDTIDAYDGTADTVSCSSGTDTVEADSIDTLTNCENVTTH